MQLAQLQRSPNTKRAIIIINQPPNPRHQSSLWSSISKLAAKAVKLLIKWWRCMDWKAIASIFDTVELFVFLFLFAIIYGKVRQMTFLNISLIRGFVRRFISEISTIPIEAVNWLEPLVGVRHCWVTCVDLCVTMWLTICGWGGCSDV